MSCHILIRRSTIRRLIVAVRLAEVDEQLRQLHAKAEGLELPEIQPNQNKRRPDVAAVIFDDAAWMSTRMHPCQGFALLPSLRCYSVTKSQQNYKENIVRAICVNIHSNYIFVYINKENTMYTQQFIVVCIRCEL